MSDPVYVYDELSGNPKHEKGTRIKLTKQDLLPRNDPYIKALIDACENVPSDYKKITALRDAIAVVLHKEGHIREQFERLKKLGMLYEASEPEATPKPTPKPKAKAKLKVEETE